MNKHIVVAVTCVGCKYLNNIYCDHGCKYELKYDMYTNTHYNNLISGKIVLASEERTNGECGQEAKFFKWSFLYKFIWSVFGALSLTAFYCWLNSCNLL